MPPQRPKLVGLIFGLIIIYFWSLKRPEVLGNGHVFFAGIINDVVMGIPLGLSSLSYLIVMSSLYFWQLPKSGESYETGLSSYAM